MAKEKKEQLFHFAGILIISCITAIILKLTIYNHTEWGVVVRIALLAGMVGTIVKHIIKKNQNEPSRKNYR